MNYAEMTCLFCGLAFEELPFYGCCTHCYSSSESVRAVVDEVHPVSANAFKPVADDMEVVS